MYVKLIFRVNLILTLKPISCRVTGHSTVFTYRSFLNVVIRSKGNCFA